MLPSALSGIKAWEIGKSRGERSGNVWVAGTWAADLVGEALWTRAGVPGIPFDKG